MPRPFTLRVAAAAAAVLAILGPTTSGTVAQEGQTTTVPTEVGGSASIKYLTGGDFEVVDGVFQYRHYPMDGELWRVSDQRLAGTVSSEWNWNVSAASGPVQSWGTITILGRHGTWSGDFTGNQFRDYEPIAARAVLYGDGEYQGLSASLDIMSTGTAGDETWLFDGVVAPLVADD
jgi:hypothetical protein